MVIVYCGDLWEGSTCRMRMMALRSLGHVVCGVDATSRPCGLRKMAVRVAARLGFSPQAGELNRSLVSAAQRHRPEVVWVDKGLRIPAATLRAVREVRPGVSIVHYSPDDMAGKHNQSRRYVGAIPAYDLHVTTKSYNVPELRALGARDVLFLNNAYCTRTHRPVPVTGEDRVRFGGQAGFIGAFEEERAEDILYLAENGVSVRVWGGWGGGWRRWAARHGHSNLRVEDRAVWGDDYAKALCSFDVNLGFLRKLNRDLQTTRSVEIPACGAFMLMESSPEHQRLFAAGLEADFFSSRQELLEKCRHYLAQPELRVRIARAGRKRCVESGYSYEAHAAAVLGRLRPEVPGTAAPACLSGQGASR